MFIKQFRKLGSVSGWAAGALGTFNIPKLGTFYGLVLVFTGTAVTAAKVIAAVKDIILRINNNIIFPASPTFAINLYDYYNEQVAALPLITSVAPAGTWALPISFIPNNLLTDIEQSAYALGMADVNSFTLELQAQAAITDVANIDVYGIFTDERRVLGRHIRLSRVNLAAPGVGALTDYDSGTLPIDNAQNPGLMAIHIEEGEVDAATSDKISVATLSLDTIDVFEKVPANVNNITLMRIGRTRQAGYYHIDLNPNNELDGFVRLGGVNDMRLKMNWLADASRTSYNVYLQEVYGIPQKAITA